MQITKIKETTMNLLSVVVLYSVIVLGVVLINARLGQINEQKSADVSEIQTAQNNNVN